LSLFSDVRENRATPDHVFPDYRLLDAAIEREWRIGLVAIGRSLASLIKAITINMSQVAHPP
jgi:hypothetical protein